MSWSEHLEQLMGALAHELDLEALEFDEDNMCMLHGEAGMSLALLLDESDQSLSLAARIISIPDTDRAALCEKLLKMNFLLLETRGNTLSIDEEGREVVVCRQLALAGSHPAEFVQQVLNFLLLSSDLREQLTPVPGATEAKGNWIAG